MKRRNFIINALKGSVLASIPLSLSSFNIKNTKLKIGIVSDVHQDIIHDGVSRLSLFISEMKKRKPDFIIQLGDFSLPRKQNQLFIDKWNSFNGPKYHVLGNHDMKDFGYKKEETMRWWKMQKRYYSFDLNGFHFIVLDGN
ncbi:MAG: alkaline phosphatase, partial [Flavobacteriaceae bacterium]|nr:alkaline phosphatase [Flavobacteriaceae bacterium]